MEDGEVSRRVAVCKLRQESGLRAGERRVLIAQWLGDTYEELKQRKSHIFKASSVLDV